MKAYELRGGFGIGSVQLIDRPQPQPGLGQAMLIADGKCKFNRVEV